MTTPREAKSLAACVCMFQRGVKVSEADDGGCIPGPWETGVAVLACAGVSDVTIIVDLDGKSVDEIYDYELSYSQGYFTASNVDEFQKSNQEEERAAPDWEGIGREVAGRYPNTLDKLR